MDKFSKKTFPLEDVPDLVLLCIANHLSNDDARNLSTTCKRFKDILPNYPIPLTIKGPNIKEYGPHDGHFCPTKYFESPVLKSTVEQINLSMKWNDQVSSVLYDLSTLGF